MTILRQLSRRHLLRAAVRHNAHVNLNRAVLALKPIDSAAEGVSWALASLQADEPRTITDGFPLTQGAFEHPYRNGVRDERHFRLWNYMAECRAYRVLTAAERAVLSELALAFNGTNNGRIVLSVRDAARRCNIAHRTAAKALRRLQELGFIDRMISDSHGRAAKWRLTWWGCNVTGEPASRRFLARH